MSPNETDRGSSEKRYSEIMSMLNRIQVMLQPQTTTDVQASQLQLTDDQQTMVVDLKIYI